MDNDALELNLPGFCETVASTLDVHVQRVSSAIELLQAGNTLPFIARYRKEATQGLDETQLHAVQDAWVKAQDLHARKQTVLKSIASQGLLDDALRRQIHACDERQALEHLYLPFKPKRRTRATIARERGLQPLADELLRGSSQAIDREKLLDAFVDAAKDVPDRASALQGALDIVAESWADRPATRDWLIQQARDFGYLHSHVKRGKKEAGAKFEMYYDHRESVKRIPSHRMLAMKRGEAEGILRIDLELDEEFVLRKLKTQLLPNRGTAFDRELNATVEDGYKRLMLPATESSIVQELKERSDEEAIRVFSKNLRELLLAPPAGRRATLGIDPGFRTGCKVVVVDGTGKHLAHRTIYPTAPRNDVEAATKSVLELIEQYHVELVAIGNGTASRETDAFVADLIRDHKLDVTKVMVSESGASIYSASKLAVHEYPHLDVTVRGAISIAHRLQDPLAELVKIDPKSIGVGQYQHDVNQAELKRSLDREVESCVNAVGVDLNTASPSLLAFVSGLGPRLAERIVEYRDEQGGFASRHQLSDVPKLGAKAFQQSAGFLRISGGDQPLDDSAVHPESYYVVQKMAKRLNTSPAEMIGQETLAANLDPQEFVDDRAGLPTIKDIIQELCKPGRDPRREFEVVKFAEGVNDLEDLRVGMVLQGVITNVTKFGAFVDVGVHQDGLVHISQLADTFVKDPADIVSCGDIVKVKVLEVDVPRKRISLTRSGVGS